MSYRERKTKGQKIESGKAERVIGYRQRVKHGVIDITAPPTKNGVHSTRKTPPKANPASAPLPRRWHEIARRFDPASPLVGVEIGVYKGQNAAEMLRRLPGLQLTMIDAWAPIPCDDGSLYWGNSPEQWDGIRRLCADNVAFAGDRVTILRQPSAETSGAPALADFVFVDGDHSESGCYADLCTWWPHVKPGGWFGGHDYGNGPKAKSQYDKPGVKLAVDRFATENGLIVSIGHDKTWWIRKRPDAVPLIVSFWRDTPESGTYYRDTAAELIASCERLGLDHEIREAKRIPGAAAKTGFDLWKAINLYKPRFIQSVIKRRKRSVMWVDCDSVFDHVPELPPDCDIAVAPDAPYPPGKPPKYDSRFAAAIVGFNRTPGADKVLSEWAHRLETTDENDHVAIDQIARRAQQTGEYRVAVLPPEYYWRGMPTDRVTVFRTRKRARGHKPHRDAKLVTVVFGDNYADILSAHKASIRCNLPHAAHEVIEIDNPPAEHQTWRPKWSGWNRHKFRFWVNAVRDNIGGKIILLDADTIITNDIRERFEQDHEFDICFTDRQSNVHPINGGVVFVRCNARSLAFFEAWDKWDDRIYNDQELWSTAQRVAHGQNQASLGMLMQGGGYDARIALVPCDEWNCVNQHWKSYQPGVTRLLHVKSGGLREFCMRGDMYALRSDWHSNAPALISTWNLWCPPGAVRPVFMERP